MQRAYRGGAFKIWMNNDTGVKARGQPGRLHPSKQRGRSAALLSTCKKLLYGERWARTTALRKGQMDPLWYQ